MDKIDTGYSIGSVYAIKGVDFVVARREYIRRGRMAGGYELTLAPLGDMRRKSAYAMRAQVRIGEPTRGLEAARGAYDKATLDAAIATTLANKEAVEGRKEARAEAGREAIVPASDFSAPAIEGGVVVTVRYAGVQREEKCVGVNWGTGKVAIDAPEYASGKRWLLATQVVGVKKAQRACPVALTDAERVKLEGQGWVQATRGREFIERSAVVAKTAEDAKRRGTTYDTPSDKVYQDPKSQLFWRDTGCFD